MVVMFVHCTSVCRLICRSPTAAATIGDGSCVVDVVVFTSTGEVEGMLKSLKAMGLDWEDVVKRNPGMVAVHGPVTATGAESGRVGVDVVGS